MIATFLGSVGESSSGLQEYTVFAATTTSENVARQVGIESSFR